MIAGVIIGAGRGWGCAKEGLEDEAGGMESWRLGRAGSQGPGDDELGGVGDEPRCSAWLMRKASWNQCTLPFFVFGSPPSIYFYNVFFTVSVSNAFLYDLGNKTKKNF